MPCASNPLPLLLLEPRSRQGILRRSCAGAAHASQTRRCAERAVLDEGGDCCAYGRHPFEGGEGAVLVCSEPALDQRSTPSAQSPRWINAPLLKRVAGTLRVLTGRAQQLSRLNAGSAGPIRS